jgi:uncharacterized protein (TIGR02145 family)
MRPTLLLALASLVAAPFAQAQSLPSDTVHFAGVAYPTVIIGGQTWFATNLSTEVFANGDPLAAPRRPRRWVRTDVPAVSPCPWPWGGDVAPGLLYNGYAVLDPRGLCPAGWRVPSDADWDSLAQHLGPPTQAARQLKSLRWDGDDPLGFAAHPVGFRSRLDGTHVYAGTFAYFWSSTPQDEGIAVRHLALHFSHFYRGTQDPHMGFSVRCVQDTVPH